MPVSVVPTPVVQSMERGAGIADEITKLSALKEQGVLSASEFEVAKARVLGS